MQAAVILTPVRNSELQTGPGATVLTRCNARGTALLPSRGETTRSPSVCPRDEHHGAGFTRGGGWSLAALPTHTWCFREKWERHSLLLPGAAVGSFPQPLPSPVFPGLPSASHRESGQA